MGSDFSRCIYSRECDGEMYNDISKFSIVDISECPRFRSWAVNADKPELEVRGRCGGYNDKSDIPYMMIQDNFINCYEDSEDCTYMRFIYSLDEKKWKKFINKYADKIE